MPPNHHSSLKWEIVPLRDNWPNSLAEKFRKGRHFPLTQKYCLRIIVLERLLSKNYEFHVQFWHKIQAKNSNHVLLKPKTTLSFIGSRFLPDRSFLFLEVILKSPPPRLLKHAENNLARSFLLPLVILPSRLVLKNCQKKNWYLSPSKTGREKEK